MPDLTKSINLEGLPPAPWKSDGKYGEFCYDGEGEYLLDGVPVAVEAAVLGRNALDVMLRRGWNPFLYHGKWHLSLRSITDAICLELLQWNADHEFADPFTCLIEADRWYRQNIEKEKP